jgi:hypothetical protein
VAARFLRRSLLFMGLITSALGLGIDVPYDSASLSYGGP